MWKTKFGIVWGGFVFKFERVIDLHWQVLVFYQTKFTFYSINIQLFPCIALSVYCWNTKSSLMKLKMPFHLWPHWSEGKIISCWIIFCGHNCYVPTLLYPEFCPWILPVHSVLLHSTISDISRLLCCSVEYQTEKRAHIVFIYSREMSFRNQEYLYDSYNTELYLYYARSFSLIYKGLMCKALSRVHIVCYQDKYSR